jgi:ABC-type sugar transport system substrate-binding protein
MSEPQLISLNDHPGAAPSIRRAKARGGLVAFLLVALAGYMHGADVGSLLFRALLGGMVGYLLTWGAAVAVWRHLLGAQAIAAVRRARARQAETEA